MVYTVAAPTRLYIKVSTAYLYVLCCFAGAPLGQSPLKNSLFCQKQKKKYLDIIVTLMLFSDFQSKQCNESSDMTEYIYQYQ